MLRNLALATGAVLMLSGGLSVPVPAAASEASPPPTRTAGLLGRALAEAADDNWAGAFLVAQNAGPLAVALVEWHRLRAGAGDWRAVIDFASVHPDWPGIAWKFRQAEEDLAAADLPPKEVIAYFADHPPATTEGTLALLSALDASGNADAAAELARRIWRSRDLTPPQQAVLLAGYAAKLAPLHADRLDTLLWRGAAEQVAQLLPLMGADHARLAAARLGLRNRVDGVNALIEAVPAALAGDPGLAHDRFQWRLAAGLHEGAAALMLERSASRAELGRPDAWARGRALLARRALSEDDPRLAYRLAAGHWLEEGAQFADLEWLAGFIALRRLDDPATALRHFETLRVRVGTPISLARAGYWEGRAHAALGDAESAQAAYAFAAEHQTTYYGILAAEAAGLPMDPTLAGTEPVPDWRAASFMQSSVLQAALLLREAGEWHLARRFVLHLAQSLSAEELGALAHMAIAFDEPNWAVNIAKIAAQRGLVLPRVLFPVTGLTQLGLPVPDELVLAIARQESEFDPRAVSPADARGLLQVLPGTAQMMARRIGMEYSEARLTGDGPYNARLGAEYLAQLSEEFGRSWVLVAAGYNAGPGRPRRWVQDLGDPRDPGVDPIDWVESVPFAETRNYIMRVMEALWVYQARLNGGPVALRPLADLRGG